MLLNLAHTLPRSSVNGPGERFVLWVQGCPLACSGCWNPDTWRFAKRNLRRVEEVTVEILATAGIEGVTFSGGEPFAQALALAHVGRVVRDAGLSVFVFTGYTRDELTQPAHRALLDVTDVLVDGRYIAAQRAEGLAWRGSSNQRVHFLSDRYSEADMLDVPAAEFVLEANGGLSVTGFPTFLSTPPGVIPPAIETAAIPVDT